MKSGPKPKPSTLEEIAARQQNLGPLVKPEWLPKGAAEVWDEQAPLARGVKTADSAGFADYCLCLYRLRRLELRIEREGLMVKGENKARVKNPACQLAREYRMSVQRWAGEFGLTPAAGTKIEIYGDKSGAPAGKPKQPTRPNLLSGQWNPDEVTQ
jgi:P27 family predicted phage terminase small subunit